MKSALLTLTINVLLLLTPAASPSLAQQDCTESISQSLELIKQANQQLDLNDTNTSTALITGATAILTACQQQISSCNTLGDAIALLEQSTTSSDIDTTRALLTGAGTLLSSCSSPSIPPSSEIAPTSASSLDNIELAYVIPGECGDLTPSGEFLSVDGNGVFEVTTGRRLFDIAGNASFNPNGSLIVDGGFGENGAVHNVPSGQILYTIPRDYFPQFSPNGDTLLTKAALLDAQTGTIILEMQQQQGQFSRDGRILFAVNIGVFNLPTGEKLMDVPQTTWSSNGVLSPTGEYLAIHDPDSPNDAAVYNISTGLPIFPITNSGQFSPNGAYLAINQDGIYRVETGEKLISTTNQSINFSPDSSLAIISEEGIYNIAIGERLLEINQPFFGPRATGFTPDNRLIIIRQDGVYDISTGEKLFSIGGTGFTLEDNNLLVVNNDGIYDISSRQRILEIGRVGGTPPITGPDNTIFVTIEGEFEFEPADDPNDPVSSRQDTNSCTIYAQNQGFWPFRAGLVEASEVIDVHAFPGGGGTVTNTYGRFPILARTDDNKWFAIFYPHSTGQRSLYSWVSADDVRIISMPDGIPTDTGSLTNLFPAAILNSQ